MTPEELERKYRQMYANEILLSDPIGWMRESGTEFIVMTAASHGQAGAGYAGRYRKVALCEVEKGVTPG